MKNRAAFLVCLVVLACFCFSLSLSAAVKQVRVIVDRANIYAEPSRTSARIETVEKGTVLNLFQERKVRNVWYYVSFQSSRLGSRISGFIHESAVELVGEKKLPVPKKEEIPAPPPIKIEEKKVVVETILATPLQKIKAMRLPPSPRQLKEAIWKPLAPSVTPAPSEKKEIKVEQLKPTKPIEIISLTSVPRGRSIRSPRREKPWEDTPWKILPLVAEQKKLEKEEKKEEAKEKPKAAVLAKPSPPPPSPAPAPRPARRARERGLLTVGLGYGPSMGGAGALVQLNTKAGFSIHAGVGVYPTTLIYSETNWVKNELLYSLGIKYYLPFKTSSFFPYLDVQFGGIKVEAAQMVLGIWDFTYVLDHEQKALQGISALAGGELRRGRFGVSGALGLGYVLTNWKYLEQRLSFGFDFNILVYF